MEEIEILLQRGSNSDILKARSLRAELEPFIGYVEYDFKRDDKGNIIRKPYEITRGKRKGEIELATEYDTERILRRVPGQMQIVSSRAQRIKEASNLGRRFSERTFETFNAGLNKKAFEDARFYADRENLFEDARNCLIILGGIGTGKTHLASAIANRFCERNIETIFATWEMHLQRMREEIKNQSISTYLGAIQNAQVLVIDDLGREKRSEWTTSTLYSVINYRYEHLFPTIITSNLEDSELFTWVGGDVASRLKEMATAIRTYGDDYRKVMAGA